MNSQRFFTNLEDIVGLQSNQNKKALQSNQDNKISLNYKVLEDKKYSNQNKYNKLESLVETTCNDKETDWINLCYKDKSSKHDIMKYDNAECCKNFIFCNSTKY